MSAADATLTGEQTPNSAPLGPIFRSAVAAASHGGRWSM